VRGTRRKAVKMETTVFDWDGTLVDVDEKRFLCINEALANIGSPKLSKQSYINGYWVSPYENPGARLSLRRILTDWKIVEKAHKLGASEEELILDL